MELSNSKKVWLCLIINFITMLFVLLIVSIFRSEKSTYFKFGPSNDLIVISVEINTWKKWILLNIFIWMVKGCDVLVNEIGSPILVFRVYNQDKKIIQVGQQLRKVTSIYCMPIINGFKKLWLHHSCLG